MPRCVRFFVVMPKLHQVVIALFRDCLFPRTFIAKALGTATVQRKIDARYALRHHRTETRTPATLCGHRRVAHKHNLHRTAFDDPHRLRALRGQFGSVLLGDLGTLRLAPAYLATKFASSWTAGPVTMFCGIGPDEKPPLRIA